MRWRTSSSGSASSDRAVGSHTTAGWSIAAIAGHDCGLFRHPIDDRPLNLVEQINQTWTYAVAIAAARQLLLLHPEADGFHLAPGAHMARDLDVMSVAPGLVGAETFAAVHPRNNGKLEADITKLAARAETHRYAFFLSPAFPGHARQPQFERDGVQVWSVDV